MNNNGNDASAIGNVGRGSGIARYLFTLFAAGVFWSFAAGATVFTLVFAPVFMLSGVDGKQKAVAECYWAAEAVSVMDETWTVPLFCRSEKTAGEIVSAINHHPQAAAQAISRTKRAITFAAAIAMFFAIPTTLISYAAFFLMGTFQGETEFIRGAMVLNNCHEYNEYGDRVNRGCKLVERWWVRRLKSLH